MIKFKDFIDHLFQGININYHFIESSTSLNKFYDQLTQKINLSFQESNKETKYSYLDLFQQFYCHDIKLFNVTEPLGFDLILKSKKLFEIIQNIIKKSNLNKDVKEYFAKTTYENFIKEKSQYHYFTDNMNFVINGIVGGIYCPSTIFQEIKRIMDSIDDPKLIEYIISLDHKELLRVYIPSWYTKEDFHIFEQCCVSSVKLIHAFLELNPYLFKPLHINNFRINTYISKINKKFNYKNKTFDRKHINSGETGHLLNMTEYQYSNIYRAEEMHKVMLHECIHALGIYSVQIKNKYFAVNKKTLLVSESIAELLALICNSILLAHSQEEAYFFIKYEFQFSILQIAKIILISGFHSFREVLDSKNNIKIHQQTSVTEYFIIKTILLFYLDDILKIVIESKDEDILADKLNDILDNFMNNKNNALEIMTNFVDTIKKNIIDNFDQYDTNYHDALYSSRMTIIEPKYSLKNT
jgi:hypothetical protein